MEPCHCALEMLSVQNEEEIKTEERSVCILSTESRGIEITYVHSVVASLWRGVTFSLLAQVNQRCQYGIEAMCIVHVQYILREYFV